MFRYVLLVESNNDNDYTERVNVYAHGFKFEDKWVYFYKRDSFNNIEKVAAFSVYKVLLIKKDD